MNKRLAVLTLIPALLMGMTTANAERPSVRMNKPSQDIATTSPQGHQPIKAKIVDPNPSHLTIDVKTIANLGADQNAPTFALYTTPRPPAHCGDFAHLEITYQKPTQYTRAFNLSHHRDVLKAINSYGCVVIKNIPPSAG